MAILKLYPNGITGGKPGKNNNFQKRGNTKGWTPSVSRRMTKFLYSVGIPSLTGSGFSFTFTIKDCPPTAKDWASLVHKLTTIRFKRMGAVRYQWLTEWQRRGVPHLHGCVYFDNPTQANQLISHWIDLASEFNPHFKCQNVKPIYDDVGWYKYLSKHCVRGVVHYQRNSNNIPEQWKTNTGRMWGKGGDWGVAEPTTFDLDSSSFARFRRIIRGYRKAKARSEFQDIVTHILIKGSCDSHRFLSAKANIAKARRLLKSNNPKISDIRGINEFFDYDDGFRILLHLKNDYSQSEIEQV